MTKIYRDPKTGKITKVSYGGNTNKINPLYSGDTKLNAETVFSSPVFWGLIVLAVVGLIVVGIMSLFS